MSLVSLLSLGAQKAVVPIDGWDWIPKKRSLTTAAQITRVALDMLLVTLVSACREEVKWQCKRHANLLRKAHSSELRCLPCPKNLRAALTPRYMHPHALHALRGRELGCELATPFNIFQPRRVAQLAELAEFALTSCVNNHIPFRPPKYDLHYKQGLGKLTTSSLLKVEAKHCRQWQDSRSCGDAEAKRSPGSQVGRWKIMRCMRYEARVCLHCSHRATPLEARCRPLAEVRCFSCLGCEYLP